MKVVVKAGVNCWLVWLIEPNRTAWHLLHSTETEGEAKRWANRMIRDLTVQWLYHPIPETVS